MSSQSGSSINNSHDHRQPRRERSHSSISSHYESPQAGSPPPTTVFPPPLVYLPSSLGYQPPQGQHPYAIPPPLPPPLPPSPLSPQPPRGFINNYNLIRTHNNNSPYQQPAASSYFSSQLFLTQQHESQVSGFVRAIIGTVILILSITCVTSIIMWLFLRPLVPAFRINNFSVSNFDATSSRTFTATWDANITVENPNTKLKVHFDQIQTYVYYSGDDVLQSSHSDPFAVDRKANRVFRTTLEVNGSDTGVGSWVVESMLKDKSSTGNVTFDIRMALWSIFKSGSWWARHVTIRVYCENLVVSFIGNSGNGTFDHNGMPKDCLVFA
ncbi:NDR1/HIN1-like protein 10 [Mercurialis annua]|uniref:NDR1/HIN1-like protein 10 n=1 Tax=Mercurialis annua TaxID=3986 RepID=UPI00215EFA92|nr:NDR1/HIN1-like protein 10 [Mercurialis annua]